MSGPRWPWILAAIVCLVVLGWQAGPAAGSKREAATEIAGGDAHADDTAGLARQLRASEARWRAIVESAVDGIVVIDAGGRIEAFNPAAERLFGLPHDELVGRPLSMLLAIPGSEVQSLAYATRAETFAVEARARQGLKLQCSASFTPLSGSDDRPGFGVILSGIPLTVAT